MEDIAEMMESQFVFYTPIFVYSLLISDSWSTPFGYYPFRTWARGPMGFFWARPAFYESPVEPRPADHCVAYSRTTLVTHYTDHATRMSGVTSHHN